MPGNSCFEGQVLHQHVATSAERLLAVSGLYASVAGSCNSGNHNLQCVSNAQFADRPAEWLAHCNSQLGPQPAASGAVCMVAQRIRDDLSPKARGYRQLNDVLNAAMTACASVPLPCIVQSDQCLSEPDIRHCFNLCMRTGSMAHAMEIRTTTLTTTTPPTTTWAKFVPVATTLPPHMTTTGTKHWLSKMVDNVLDTSVESLFR